MSNDKKGDGTVAIYAPRAFKFNTGDVSLGLNGLIDIPAGASRIDAKFAAHQWVKQHTGEAPGADAAGDIATVAEIEIGELKARLARAEAERDDALAQAKGASEETEGLRLALNSTPDERLAATESKLSAATAEISQLRAALDKAQKAASGKK